MATQARAVSRKNETLILIGVTASLALLTYGIGLQNIISKPQYLMTAHRVPWILGKFLCLGSLGLLGYSFNSSRTVGKKILSICLGVAIWMVFFSEASRAFSVSPLIVAGGYWLSSEKKVKDSFIAVGSGVLSLLLISVPTTLRGLSPLGLEPFLSAIISGSIHWNSPVSSILNIVVSVPLIGATMNSGRLGANHLVMSLSPLPGSVIGWYAVAYKYRIGTYIPFSGIGELFSYGYAVPILYFGSIGFIFSWMERCAKKAGDIIRVVAICSFSTLFVFSSLQYNLRSMTRYVYYLIVIITCLMAWKYIKRRLSLRVAH